MYESIPQQDLRWLNNLSGKTGAALEASDQAAPEGWLPSGIASRLEAGKAYVMTLAGDAGTEIIAVTGSALVRGLEGTTPREWPAGTEIFQAVTAGQIQTLVEGPAGSGTAQAISRHLVRIASDIDGHVEAYGFGYLGGEMSPAEVAGIGEVQDLQWMKEGGYYALSASPLSIPAGTAVTVDIAGVRIPLGATVSTGILITKLEFDALPKSGVTPVKFIITAQQQEELCPPDT